MGNEKESRICKATIERFCLNEPSLRTIERDGKGLHDYLTYGFMKSCKKEKVCNTPKMLTAHMNAQYRLDEKQIP